MLESGDNPIADLVALLFSVAWSILTYFVVPVVIFEDVSVTEGTRPAPFENVDFANARRRG